MTEPTVTGHVDLEKLGSPILPGPQPGETADVYVIGCPRNVRGKRNPIFEVSIYGLTFPQYRMPADATVIRNDDRGNPIEHRPTLPLVRLTPSQVKAIRDRAAMLPFVLRSNSPYDDELGGGKDQRQITLSYTELIFIEKYVEGADVFDLARKAAEAAEARWRESLDEADKEAAAAGADEQSAALAELAISNRKQDRPSSKPKTR